MISSVFAFGPGNTWFFESSTVWKWGDLPTAVYNRFPKNGEVSVGPKIAHVHNMVFGANGSYMITWKGKDGKSYQVNHGLPLNLSNWLDKKDAKGFLTRDVQNIRLALGPNNSSFFVSDGKDFLWQGLPSGLADSINKLRNKKGAFTTAPRLVCLGVNGSYIMITEGNGGSWNVAAEYPDLDKFLDDLKASNGNKGGMFANVSNISLDAFDAGNFIVTWPVGGYKARLPDQMMEPFKTVAATVRSHIPQAPARRQSSGLGGILKLANLILNVENNAMAAGGGNNNFGGGGGNAVDFTQANMVFTQGLQDQTWSSVDNAASNWNVQ